MMYPTHKKLGYAFGLAGIPIVSAISTSEFAQNNNLLPAFGIDTLELSNPFSIIYYALIVCTALWASLYGAGFPDIDSPGSIPANANIINKGLSYIYRITGVHHRGKFSHGVDSLTIVFLITYCFITFLIPTAMTGLLTDDSLSNNMYLFMLNFGKGGAFISLAQIFVIFSWIGAMSHMFGDMSTREGVYLSGVAALIANNRTKVKIVPTFIIKPFGNFVDTSQWFSTDSNWEISFRQAVNIVIYVLAGVNILYFLGVSIF
ncbi:MULTISPECIES: metal-dependent hydrolase [Bacillus amyloliquefaciens group]|uniref:metal-dependent hydrolase n=1 Tax=Bacillus amyloliquefaciens group TaxID=1938374 RepID=UPI00226FC6A7|nr:metal-dependent hydrolase [Bacillus velezensis]MCY0092142.1 metal-dependent hydrolase [Bacillus velezensis]MEC0385622.1 metal-dependent hydrolase [Bacillus velezensis]MEC0388764.1 metal-dependent hydrolase [Bacillus velezensis]HEO2443529.1 metal-dependent hydrolase [Streptococcus agalactiae]